MNETTKKRLSLRIAAVLVVAGALAWTIPAAAAPWYCTYCNCLHSCDKVCFVTNTIMSTCGDEGELCKGAKGCSRPPGPRPAGDATTELTETVANHATATSTGAQDFNFGIYNGGFIGTWKVNDDDATHELHEPAGEYRGTGCKPTPPAATEATHAL